MERPNVCDLWHPLGMRCTLGPSHTGMHRNGGVAWVDGCAGLPVPASLDDRLKDLERRLAAVESKT